MDSWRVQALQDSPISLHRQPRKDPRYFVHWRPNLEQWRPNRLTSELRVVREISAAGQPRNEPCAPQFGCWARYGRQPLGLAGFLQGTLAKAAEWGQRVSVLAVDGAVAFDNLGRRAAENGGHCVTVCGGPQRDRRGSRPAASGRGRRPLCTWGSARSSQEPRRLEYRHRGSTCVAERQSSVSNSLGGQAANPLERTIPATCVVGKRTYAADASNIRPLLAVPLDWKRWPHLETSHEAASMANALRRWRHAIARGGASCRAEKGGSEERSGQSSGQPSGRLRGALSGTLAWPFTVFGIGLLTYVRVA